MTTITPIEIKRTCCEMRRSGILPKEIYNDYFKHQFETPCTYNGFTCQLSRWMRKSFPEETTLEAGTYEGFIAHDATVQVAKDGSIVQAWIKQKASDFDPEDFIRAIKSTVEPYTYNPKNLESPNRMLEIPLFDMHWGVSFLEDYETVLDDILEIIRSRNWDRIVIPFGQDFFHNDSMVEGRTTKGTQIEKIDMARAVKEGKIFMYAIIDEAIQHANHVEVLYTPGNHDRSISWMFVQVLLERYGPFVVDDSAEYRKVISYGKNAIMVTHGDSKQATPKNLAHIFPVSFPTEFANAEIREVHAGHLHHESEADIYGVMVRRLSSGAKIDDWSNRQDFVGTHRRFMLFEWDLNSLKSIHYI